MYVDTQMVAQFIIQAAAVLGALGALCGALYGIILWFQKQGKQSVDIEKLQEKEKEDIDRLKKEEKEDIRQLRDMHSEDMKQINAELCVISYAMLACLDGLKQKGCNGPVTDAYNRLEKHLNKQAHNVE